MGNNNLKGSNEILVKVDQNNLIYIDPNTIVSNGNIEPRGVEPENLVMYVNLEADLIPRTTLITDDQRATLTSIARGSFNLMQRKDGKDFDSTWTDSFTSIKSDQTAQTFGIDSISIQVAGANFVPRVVIKFIDVRGKTLFESPENSPYGAFFHLPWPIFYLTIKGFYGKAIRYRLHCIKFNSVFNSTTGNFEIETNFIGSTYAYLADISLEAALNAPYMYISDSVQDDGYDSKTGYYKKRISKSTKGYRVLRSIYQEYKNKGLLPPNFPVRTLREIMMIATRLDKILEEMIYKQVIDHKILAGVKEYETILTNLQQAVAGWKSINLLSQIAFNDGTEKRWFLLTSVNKNTLDKIKGKEGSLEFILKKYAELLEQNITFGSQRNSKLVQDEKKIKINTIPVDTIKKIQEFYKEQGGVIGVNIDAVEDAINGISSNFVQQRVRLENDLEKEMNTIIKDPEKGFGFEPTVRNIIGVLLANAEVYIRLMKDVHDKGFIASQERKTRLSGFDTDSIGKDSIYPWPEIKVKSAGGRELILKYPGARDLIKKLQSDNPRLWPEVDFIENFISVSTYKSDPLSESEGILGKVDYIFKGDTTTDKKDVGVLTNLSGYIPYGNKNISSVIYEIYERAKYVTSLSPFNTQTIQELADAEFYNLKTQLSDDIDIVEMLKSKLIEVADIFEQMQSLSTERFVYYEDQLPTVPYIKDVISQDFSIKQYEKNTGNVSDYNGDYQNLSKFLLNYKPEGYRKDIYPFNSSLYTGYIGEMTESKLNISNFLHVNTPLDFISSPSESTLWVKDNFTSNLFTNKIKIGNTEKHILNTPYFHKQLYSDFTKVQPQEKYVGSAYLLLNSLPFKDLDDRLTLKYKTPDNVTPVVSETLVSSLFREIGATHYIPYHLILKWGSIYHRYKKYINTGVDIIVDVENPIDGQLFYDGSYIGRIYTGITNPNVLTINRDQQKDIGFHPYYDNIFHKIVNGYYFFNQDSPSAYTNMLIDGVTKSYYKTATDANTWVSFVDNSRFTPQDTRYTLLPNNGYNDIDNGNDFLKREQENFRILWSVGTSDTTVPVYSGYTLPEYNEYFKWTGSTTPYSLASNYRKIIDLIATFKPEILESFEAAFLDFASEKLNEEISFNLYDVKYNKFQDLLKEIVSVSKNSGDPAYMEGLIKKIHENQIIKLKEITSQILSTENLIKLTISNPREIDSYIFGGFSGVNVQHFSVNPFSPSQITPNLDNIQLFLGEDLNEYYQQFFSAFNIELNAENIRYFRSLIYLYAGLRAKGQNPSKESFTEYIKSTVMNPSISPTGVLGQDKRLYYFLERLIYHIQKNFKVKTQAEKTNIRMGFNDDDTLKLELYNYFKSFNDKWTSGNSIGQQTLMEEFMFLDKANRDIGDQVFLDMSRLIHLNNKKNEKINIFSAISMLVQNSGFEVRALPSYVNFYGVNYSSTKRVIPSKNVAQNLFGTFLEVDYQESSPKVILQYVGPTSKHLEMSDINKRYMYKDDGFNIGDVNRNPVIVAPDIFTKTNFALSNKVVAFEVSFGDQNQSIFQGIELDQSTIKNTSESFIVLERLGRSEAGASTAQVDIGLFDIYRSASYECTIVAMGNVMIQPTMYFYLKNVPLFRGSYWISEVYHDIKAGQIVTKFKGRRIPQQSLPKPEDSFLASYRPLFDKLSRRAEAKVQEESLQISETTGTEKVVTTPGGTVSYNPTGLIPGERILTENGITSYGLPYNGYKNEKDIQLIDYNGQIWLKTKVLQINGNRYKIPNDRSMSLLSRKSDGRHVTWRQVRGLFNRGEYYFSKFDLSQVSSTEILDNFTTTVFWNPRTSMTEEVITEVDYNGNNYSGPISVGPDINGYGIAMSAELMRKLKVHDGETIYFRMF